MAVLLVLIAFAMSPEPAAAAHSWPSDGTLVRQKSAATSCCSSVNVSAGTVVAMTPSPCSRYKRSFSPCASLQHLLCSEY